jgi:hypothetical protein
MDAASTVGDCAVEAVAGSAWSRAQRSFDHENDGSSPRAIACSVATEVYQAGISAAESPSEVTSTISSLSEVSPIPSISARSPPGIPARRPLMHPVTVATTASASRKSPRGAETTGVA